MRKTLVAVIAAALLSPLLGLLFLVAALSGIGGAHHDERSQNTHVWQRGDSGMLIEGVNEKTGKRWQSHIGVDGSRSGIDSAGHAWTYEPRSGAYHNHGTGRRCIGFGEARRCTQPPERDAR